MTGRSRARANIVSLQDKLDNQVIRTEKWTLCPNSESMSLLIDVLLAINRCYQNLSLRYQGHKESISRYE
jgi:hypothetical protein